MGEMRTRFFTSIAVFLMSGVFLCPLAAEPSRITLGFDDGWRDITRSESTRLQEGFRGFRDIVMDYRQYEPEDTETDILLHFEENPFMDHSSYYLVRVPEKVLPIASGRIGVNAAGFSRESGGLTLDFQGTDLVGKDAPLFSPGSVWGDFTMEFWLRPNYLEDGEKIFRWEGQRLRAGRLQLQTLDCSVEDRLLKWDFRNFFLPVEAKETGRFLTGRQRLIPDRWSHHLLRYDMNTGLLEYLVDGRPEAVLYVTSDGTPEGSVMKPYIGERSRGLPEIAPSYSGLMDEFRLARAFVKEPQIHRFSPTGGTVEIGPISLGEAGSEINSIETEIHRPAGTGVYSYYRTAMSRPAFDLEDPEWIPFQSGENFDPPTKGSFIMLRFELFPDGEGLLSPRVSSAVINYRPNLPPPSPPGLTALPKNGKVHLTWRALRQRDLGGYLVYYGEAPRVYRGTGSSAGDSPIDTGSATEITISSLENGTLYYFAVAAYDAAGPGHRGPLSGEVSARPSAYYGD